MNNQDRYPLGWNYKMHCKFYPPLCSVLKYQKSLPTCLPIFTSAASNSIFHGGARLIFPSFLSFFFFFSLLFFSYIFFYFPLFLYLMHHKSHHFPAVNPSITSYGLNIPNFCQALESFDFISSLTAHRTPATLVFFL